MERNNTLCWFVVWQQQAHSCTQSVSKLSLFICINLVPLSFTKFQKLYVLCFWNLFMQIYRETEFCARLALRWSKFQRNAGQVMRDEIKRNKWHNCQKWQKHTYTLYHKQHINYHYGLPCLRYTIHTLCVRKQNACKAWHKISNRNEIRELKENPFSIFLCSFAIL